ncbi:hypothetical protein HaLaN_10059 [Haematococcus lacustris]|uniref:Uncharacterized protein n=1 Tax=Haematococcus lacustris TaxID=44745 RepID=A0A699YV05_HAELA|nr:hypothetical protein HaLaN_10059 [Haematococcus lacustris]
MGLCGGAASADCSTMRSRTGLLLHCRAGTLFYGSSWAKAVDGSGSLEAAALAGHPLPAAVPCQASASMQVGLAAAAA